MWVLVALAAALALAPPLSAPLTAQTSLLGPPPGPAPEVGASLGWWRVSGPDASPEIKRRAWSVQFTEGGVMLEGLWAKEEGVNPGFLGILGFSSFQSVASIIEFEAGIGIGAVQYRADERAAIAAECGRTPGCFFEAEGLRSGWTGVGALRTSTHLVLGKVSAGPWIVRSLKALGHGGPDGRHGPGGQGWEIRIRTR